MHPLKTLKHFIVGKYVKTKLQLIRKELDAFSLILENENTLQRKHDASLTIYQKLKYYELMKWYTCRFTLYATRENFYERTAYDNRERLEKFGFYTDNENLILSELRALLLDKIPPCFKAGVLVTSYDYGWMNLFMKFRLMKKAVHYTREQANNWNHYIPLSPYTLTKSDGKVRRQQYYLMKAIYD